MGGWVLRWCLLGVCQCRQVLVAMLLKMLCSAQQLLWLVLPWHMAKQHVWA